jgi:hypothetical protein
VAVVTNNSAITFSLRKKFVKKVFLRKTLEQIPFSSPRPQGLCPGAKDFVNFRERISARKEKDMAELLVNPLVPLDIIVKGIRMTTDPVVGRVLTSDAEGNGSWQTGGGGGPTSSLIDPVTIFGGTANAILSTGPTIDPLITYNNLSNGQVLIGSTGAAPVASTIAPGANILINNGPGSVSVALNENPSITSIHVSNGIVAATVDAGGAIMGNNLTITSSIDAESAQLESLRLTDGAVAGYLLRCADGLGNASWSAPSSDLIVAAGPTGNLTSTFTAPNTYTVDTKLNPIFTSVSTNGLIHALGAIHGDDGLESETSVETPLYIVDTTAPAGQTVSITAPTLAANSNIVIPDTTFNNNIMVLGARQTVNQTVSLSTAVTINSPSGKIFCFPGSTVGSGASTQFTVFNFSVKTTSQLFVTCNGPLFGALSTYSYSTKLGASDGTFLICITAFPGQTVTGNFIFSFLIL